MGVHDADYSKIRELVGAAEDEPLFIIRGQDVLAIPAIARYQGLAMEAELGEDFINGLNNSVALFATWQTDNPEAVRKPD